MKWFLLGFAALCACVSPAPAPAPRPSARAAQPAQATAAPSAPEAAPSAAPEASAAAVVPPPPEASAEAVPTEVADERCSIPQLTSGGTRSLQSFNGMDGDALRACLGEPDQSDPHRWIYRQPDGCSDWRTILTVTFSRGRVAYAEAERKWTGEHCADMW